MANPHGTPIWYELLTPDHAASKTFYDAVFGWDIEPKPAGDIDYRMIGTADGGQVGGVMALSDAMKDGGAQPGWLFYLGVDDVDTTADRLSAAGGAVLMPPFDLPGVGRMAFVADPTGAPFYIMRGAIDAASTVWHPDAPGRCNWNELASPDQRAANVFYADLFGWTYPHSMEMPGDGSYSFIEAAGETLGATMPARTQAPPRWYFYFGVPDIDAAAAAVHTEGGTVVSGPMAVPGGRRVIFASDPHGVLFGAVGPGED